MGGAGSAAWSFVVGVKSGRKASASVLAVGRSMALATSGRSIVISAIGHADLGERRGLERPGARDDLISRTVVGA